MNVDSRTGHGLDRQQVLRMLTSTIFDCAIYRGYGVIGSPAETIRKEGSVWQMASRTRA